MATFTAANPDFGTDLSCTSDLDPNAAEVNGTLGLAQALYRRLITARGGLIDDPTYGFDVASMLDDAMTNRQIAVIASMIDSEMRKDQRVLTSKTSGTWTPGAGNAGKYVATSLITSAFGPFSLVISVSSVTTTLLAPTR